MNYKKATRIGLRFETTKGVLSVEQLWTFKTKDIEECIRNLNRQMKQGKTETSELDFLGEVLKSPEQELNELRFEIMKDIWTTKKEEVNNLNEEYKKKEHNKTILNLIAKKEEEDLNNLSVEELKKKLL